MAMRTEQGIVCECGHGGVLHCKENDAPFSRMYEDYTVEGFSKESLSVTSETRRPPDLLAAMNIKCPACGAVGKVAYA